MLRANCGEYIRTFWSLVDNEALFFNYTRMTYDTYKELLALVIPLLQPTGANWRQPITCEEKLPVGGRIFVFVVLYFCNLCGRDSTAICDPAPSP